MRLLIASDAWRPQVNGVVRTLERLGEELGRLGIDVTMLTPDRFRSFPMPTYPEITLALAWPKTVGAFISAARPDAIHIATEGPIGFTVRRWCVQQGRAFTTSFHTRFPDYVAARAPIPRRLTWAVLRRFHNAGRGCMVATASLEAELAGKGFERLMIWSRGVDAELFRPRPGPPALEFPRPIFVFVGRVAVEKNMAAFLRLDLPGSKVVIGDGPALPDLRAEYPAAHFLGTLTGEPLAQAYAAADVFVFPSRTDTFGIVLLEALASGTPVAAYPVSGPADVIGTSGTGVLDEDLRAAALAALAIPREKCRSFALTQSWEHSASQFLANVRSAILPGEPLPALAEAGAP